MKIGMTQFNVGMDKARHLAVISEQVARLASEGCDLIALPEMGMCITGKPSAHQAAAESIDEGPFPAAIAALAARHKVNIHAGSYMERRGDRFFNTSVVYDREGHILARYSKIHRFDIDLPDGTAIRESDVVEGGTDVVVVDVEGVRFGLSICYDIRFPELYRALCDQGADVIMVPAAFTFQTGADHWEVLLRARAIETQCYVVAAAQVGAFDDGKYLNFGHSMIVDPWGLVVAQASNREGIASASIDREYTADVRRRIPLRNHRVLKVG